MRHTKIIATVGPASDSGAALDALLAAGTDIVRLNFSHGTHASHALTFERVRQAAGRAGREVAILQDLGGPKMRTGTLQNGRAIQAGTGQRLRIMTGDFEGRAGRITTTFADLARAVRPGDRLLLADGLIELRVETTDGTEIDTIVVEGGPIGEHKGINAPGVPLPTSAVTPKDIEDLRFGLALGVDMVALSFVQYAEDIRTVRRLLAEAGHADVPVVAKLERPQALEHLDEILEACQAVMVARGDLGLEMPLERVPRIQKEITRAARRAGVPVILATQVLESMTSEARPTRAEVSDAANAVGDGVDAIMLSGETAVGVCPARTVRTLDAIIRDAEASPTTEAQVAFRRVDDDHDPAHALCAAAVTLADRGEVHAIVAVTRGGSTARRLSMLRPRAPVLATTSRSATARQLALHWGVAPVHLDLGEHINLAGSRIGEQLVGHGLIPSGASVVLINVNPDLGRPDSNYLRIQRL